MGQGTNALPLAAREGRQAHDIPPACCPGCRNIRSALHPCPWHKHTQCSADEPYALGNPLVHRAVHVRHPSGASRASFEHLTRGNMNVIEASMDQLNMALPSWAIRAGARKDIYFDPQQVAGA